MIREPIAPAAGGRDLGFSSAAAAAERCLSAKEAHWMADDGRPDLSPAVAHLRVELEHTMKRYNNALMWIDMAKAVGENRAQAPKDCNCFEEHITNG